MSKASTLTPKQQELLDAMKAGVQVLRVVGRDAYWFRADTFARCTAQADALRRKGYVMNAGALNLTRLVLKETP